MQRPWTQRGAPTVDGGAVSAGCVPDRLGHGNTDYIERYAPPEFDELVQRGGGVAGCPETVADYIEREIAQGGINYLIASLMFGDMTVTEALNSTTLYAEEVIPAFAGQGDTSE